MPSLIWIDAAATDPGKTTFLPRMTRLDANMAQLRQKMAVAAADLVSPRQVQTLARRGSQSPQNLGEARKTLPHNRKGRRRNSTDLLLEAFPTSARNLPRLLGCLASRHRVPIGDGPQSTDRQM